MMVAASASDHHRNADDVRDRGTEQRGGEPDRELVDAGDTVARKHDPVGDRDGGHEKADER